MQFRLQSVAMFYRDFTSFFLSQVAASADPEPIDPTLEGGWQHYFVPYSVISQTFLLEPICRFLWIFFTPGTSNGTAVWCQLAGGVG